MTDYPPVHQGLGPDTLQHRGTNKVTFVQGSIQPSITFVREASFLVVVGIGPDPRGDIWSLLEYHGNGRVVAHGVRVLHSSELRPSGQPLADPTTVVIPPAAWLSKEDEDTDVVSQQCRRNQSKIRFHRHDDVSTFPVAIKLCRCS